MTKRDLSELALAAVAFETELEAYKRSGELFMKTPLGSSVKHLERANATLAELAGCEERLQVAGQRSSTRSARRAATGDARRRGRRARARVQKRNECP